MLTEPDFVLAGLGVSGVPGLEEVWQTVAVLYANVSLPLLILFLHPWLIVSVLIDIKGLISLLCVNWPSFDQICV